MDAKQKAQYYALKSWKEANYKGSIFACTGFGKTRVGIVAICEHIRRNNNEKWLVLVPTINLITQWGKEAKKWGYGKEWELGVTCICYQSAHKYYGNHYHGIVADEVHMGLSENYRNLFKMTSFAKILCLTATPPEEKEYRIFLNSIAPVCYTMELERAVKEKLVSPYTIYCIKAPMTDDERQKYIKANNMFVRYKNCLGFGAFDEAKRILSDTAATSDEKRNAALYYKAIRDRGAVVKQASNKIKLTKELVDLYNDRKIITFAEDNKFTSKIAEALAPRSDVYHSGITSKKVKEATLKKFNDGRNKRGILCSTRALNAGLDVAGCSMGILCGVTSKALSMIQRINKTCPL
jgi:superfamily II DNA or RNA helicase